uniref:Apolipoprotein D n=1 Tax=Culex tarsalis TaxID=7177 RepID=A0A1Q3FPN3_CULTA
MDKSPQVFAALVVLGLTAAVYGVIYDRPCRTEVPVVQNFALERYLGKWYELQRYEQPFQQNLDCTTANYGLLDPATVSVRNSAFSLINETSAEAIGTAVLSFPEQEIVQAKLNVSFFGAPNDRSNYWVIDTDYDKFAIVWACEPLPQDRSSEGFWLLSRTRKFTDDKEANERAFGAIRKYIDQNNIRFTNQADERCPDF